jgi:hypothetical protein
LSLNYQQQAQQLASRLSEKHGLALAPGELLDTVAALHNQPNWGALRNSEKGTFRYWLRTRLFGEPELKHVLSLEELQHQMTPGQIDLGVTPDHKRAHAVEDGWLRRHLLITGQQGVGATTMLESLIAQQILRGGGILVMDPWGDLQSQVERYVGYAGRTADYQTLSLEMPHMAAQALAGAHQITYVSVPLLENGRAQLQVHDFFDGFWQAAMKRITPQGFRGTTFMVVVPNAGSLMDRKWEVRYEHARAAGLAIVAHTHGIASLERGDTKVAETILEHSWTKVFFRQPSAHCLAAAVDCIKATAPVPDTFGPVREKLVALGMGQMLISRPGHLEESRCLMLKR